MLWLMRCNWRVHRQAQLVVQRIDDANGLDKSLPTNQTKKILENFHVKDRVLVILFKGGRRKKGGVVPPRVLTLIYKVSWCVISWLYFPWNMNLGNNSFWLAKWSFCMTHEEPKLTNIHDYTSLFLDASPPLESSVQSNLRMQFAM